MGEFISPRRVRYRSHNVWLGVLAIIILGFIWWISDSKQYDRDLEKQHYDETGYLWDDVETGGFKERMRANGLPRTKH